VFELETVQVLKTSRLVNDVQNSWFSNMGKYSCVNHRINEVCRFTGAIRPGGHSVNLQTLPISSQTTPLNNICSNSASASVIPEYSLRIPIRPHLGNCGRSFVGCPDVYLYYFANYYPPRVLPQRHNVLRHSQIRSQMHPPAACHR
jgi:hypothetical protein